MSLSGCGAAKEVTSADGGWRILFSLAAQRPVAAEFLRSPAGRTRRAKS